MVDVLAQHPGLDAFVNDLKGHFPLVSVLVGDQLYGQPPVAGIPIRPSDGTDYRKKKKK